MNEYILIYDFGTNGIKVSIIDSRGNLVLSSGTEYDLITFQMGYAEQNPYDYWEAVCTATNTLLKYAYIFPEQIVAITFSTQPNGLIPIGTDDKILFNNITWLDSRAHKQAKVINEAVGENVVTAFDLIAKLLWFKENLPDIYATSQYFLDCTGYLIWKCTGAACMGITEAGPYSLDPEIASYKAHLYTQTGIDLKKIAPMVPCGQIVGNLTENAAAELGLLPATTVVMGCDEIIATALGSGSQNPGDVHIYLGSAGWLSVVMQKQMRHSCMPGIHLIQMPDVDKQIYGGYIQSVCMTLNWAIENFYSVEKSVLKGDIYSFVSSGKIYSFINSELKDIPAGSCGMLATPWLMGEQCPVSDDCAKLMFLNITNLHDRRHFIKAIMESVGYSLRAQKESFEQETGASIDRAVISGGGALSNTWVQIIADILQIPVTRYASCQDSVVFGAAIVAAKSIGWEIGDAIPYTKTYTKFEPNPANKSVYDNMYCIFKKLYPTLKDILFDLNRRSMNGL